MDDTDEHFPRRSLLGEGDTLQVVWEMVSKRKLYHGFFMLLLIQGCVPTMLLNFLSFVSLSADENSYEGLCQKCMGPLVSAKY